MCPSVTADSSNNQSNNNSDHIKSSNQGETDAPRPQYEQANSGTRPHTDTASLSNLRLPFLQKMTCDASGFISFIFKIIKSLFNTND